MLQSVRIFAIANFMTSKILKAPLLSTFFAAAAAVAVDVAGAGVVVVVVVVRVVGAQRCSCSRKSSRRAEK